MAEIPRWSLAATALFGGSLAHHQHLYRATLDVDGLFYCVSGFSHTVAGGFRSAEEPDERSTGANRDITEQ
jgi:hypothetical protein